MLQKKYHSEVIYRFGKIWHGNIADELKPETICSTRARKTVEKEGESREPHRVGAGESSASTPTDTNTSFATPSTTKWTIAEIWGLITCGDSQ